MSKRIVRRVLVPVLGGLLVVGAAFSGPTASQAAPPTASRAEQLRAAQDAALQAGLQVAPKGLPSARRSATLDPDPALSTLPSLRRADYSGWRTRDAAQAEARAGSRAQARVGRTGRASAKVLDHPETEPASRPGSNDTRATAEKVGAFGTGKGDRAAVAITGAISGYEVAARALPAVQEDDGQLSLATPTGIRGTGRVRGTGVLGDGPHGTEPGADGNNDYDFYSLAASAGERITISTAGSEVDTVVALYDPYGTVLAVNDEAVAGTTDSLLTYAVTKPGTYYALVAGFAPSGGLPPDPEDSGSGFGDASTGRYALDISAVKLDTDYYRLDLAAGDVIGATATSGATTLRVVRPDGTAMVGASGSDLSGLYPEESPLPRGGNVSIAYVAERAGAYALQVDGPPGTYAVRVEAYRPGTEGRGATRTQTILLDLDGGTVDTTDLGGPGERRLSPLRDFLPAWGLKASQEKALRDRVVAAMKVNLRRDLAARGLNKRLAVDVTTKATGSTAWGRPDVSRVVIGGTTAEAGIDTIGISSTIDPGNYSHTDTALVLLDTLASPDTDNEASLNHYLRPGSDRLDFVAQAIANVASHEVGHYVGNFHTDGQDSTHTLMDEGGSNFGANLYGVGRDGVGGTRDDEDVRFRTDAYSRLETYSGQENTLNVSAWAFVRPQG
ncbi:pre-peptidase C-terminal domain-containing protein [Microlunatus sagamiharensis]|uniref:Pre-peptidase C-terminal domain-containing protein n=1 Tax=Microlunatus sagamiharensis TaxID=546874 RepID=A0A1H2MYA6_9ACTN|nr:PPC domain-containing protein [Microlunatus sagamiharensis]SDU97901.1 pre-peptidase C-terminal domain-containing protein [Microlunatus sagamiharensis]